MVEIDAIKVLVPLVSVVLGGFVFKILFDAREKEHDRKQKAIEAIEDSANDVNRALAYLFGRFKYRTLTEENIKESISRKGLLYEKRFLIRVYSSAYLNNAKFADDYDLICRRIGNLVDLLFSAFKEEPTKLSHVEHANETIAAFEGKVFTPKDFDIAYEELIQVNEFAIKTYQDAIQRAV